RTRPGRRTPVRNSRPGVEADPEADLPPDQRGPYPDGGGGAGVLRPAGGFPPPDRPDLDLRADGGPGPSRTAARPNGPQPATGGLLTDLLSAQLHRPELHRRPRLGGSAFHSGRAVEHIERRPATDPGDQP